MKHVLTPLFLAIMTLAANAQDSDAPTPATAASTPESRPSAVNPFTGKLLNAEALQRQLELRKLETQLLEETLRAKNLEEEQQYIAGKKQAEASVAATAIAREKVAQAALEKELAASKAPPPARPDAAIRSQGKTKQTKSEEPKEAPKMRAPARPNINVLSVLSAGGKRSAMLEVGGDVVSVEDGQRTPFGVVHVTEQGVRLDEQSLTVNDSTIGRVRRAEVEQTQAPAGLRMTSSGAMVRTGEASGSNSPSVTQLPPLVLPPAVRSPTAAPGQAVEVDDALPSPKAVIR